MDVPAHDTFVDFFDSAAVGFHLVSADGTILYANRAELEMLGYAREEYVGRNIREFHVDTPVIEDILRRLGRGETLRDYEARMRAKDGSTRHVLMTSNVRRDEAGDFLHTRCLTQDVSEWRRSESARRTTEARFETLARVAPVGLFRTDAQGDCVYVNEHWCELTGLVAEEAMGAGWSATLHPEDRQRVFDEWYRATRTHAEFISEYRFRHRDGDIRCVVGRGLPEVVDGVVRGYIGCISDVTARRLHESDRERHFEDNRRLAAIIDTSDDAIVSKDVNGFILSWNRGAERIFGWTAAEAVGQHITLIIPPERHPEEDEVLARIRRGDMVDHFETVRVTKDGRYVDISLTVSPLKDVSGRIIGASKIARDITERRRLERERDRLLEREQEARREAEASNRTKDELLAVVSHELRTPLNSILGYARLVQNGALDDAARKHAVDVIVRNATALSGVVDDLLDLSRLVTGGLTLTLERCSVVDVVEEAIDVVRPAVDSKRLAIDLAGDASAEVFCTPDRIRQVVLNVLMNAIKFTPAGGHIDVSVRRCEQEVEIAVRDDGEGISQAALAHIFEPFRQEDRSTTRAHGGLGLGLALVKYLVELHGGRVTAESPGKGLGATIRTFLPVNSGPSPQSRPSTTGDTQGGQ
jgi:PAS domain S-box-containing protein